MTEFHDPEFEDMLGRTGGPMPDVNVAYQQVQGRVRQVKRRRAIVASSAACVVLLGAAVFAGARPNGNDSITPAGRGSDVSNSSDVANSSDSSPSTDSGLTSSTLVTDTGQPTTSDGGGTGSTAPGGVTPTTPGPTTSVTTPPASTNPPATDPPAPVTQTFTSGGGSITVRLQNGSLSLVGNPAPAAGYSYDVSKNGGTRVEVRFDNGTDTIDIRVDLVNGEMVQH